MLEWFAGLSSQSLRRSKWLLWGAYVVMVLIDEIILGTDMRIELMDSFKTLVVEYMEKMR